ncbi:MAG TPA: hypothetical protein VED37_18870 [Ktedonobacteraceae bacterium]|nr:hypothetical protein [Ktedonobacteraceae bacterium]
MSMSLAKIVAGAKIRSLALIGLSKNVGKTTTTNYLLETLISEKHCRSDELALTSLGLDGEATDALTGLPKPRYVPQPGLMIATAEELLLLAEGEGTQFQRLKRLSCRTALGPVTIARVLRPGRVTVSGPTLLHDLRHAIDQLGGLGANLIVVDGAINRVGAAAPTITNACIVCTGASAGATPELVARRTADVVRRLSMQQTSYVDRFGVLPLESRLCMSIVEDEEVVTDRYYGNNTPLDESRWIVKHMLTAQKPVFVLDGALTDELARTLLAELHKVDAIDHRAELAVENATRVFCHSSVIKRLYDRGLEIRVLNPIRILAITANPFTPEYLCSSQHLLESLVKALPESRPPIIDVMSGLSCS